MRQPQSNDLFQEIKSSANGLLDLDVYRKLFELGSYSNGGTFVEIGTAHGAATIALTLGAIQTEKHFHVYTADPFKGKYSSREAFGTVEDNISFVRSQFNKFRVGNYITVVEGGTEDILRQHAIENVKILLLDADGRIDRDLALLFSKLSSDCRIMIDDIDDAVHVTKRKGTWVVDQKHRISHALSNLLVANGILDCKVCVQNTGFFQKGPAVVSGEEICRIALPAYRELVFADIKDPSTNLVRSDPIRRTKDFIGNNIPFARLAYRRSKSLFHKCKPVFVGDNSVISRVGGWRIGGKPRVCILADRPGWSYDTCARQIKRRLARKFDISIRYSGDKLLPEHYDLLHVCSFADNSYKAFGFDRERVIKEISSHRWEDDPRYGPCSPVEFVERYLSGCDTVICTSRRLFGIVAKVFPRSFHAPNGVDVKRFRPVRRWHGTTLVFGWAGNVDDPVKGFREIVEPACGDRFKLLAATGGLNSSKMARFYRKVDVIVVSSRNEGTPLPLIEGMASGCFPVCVDVGIVPEVIEHTRNGYIVPERTVEAFQKAFEWCERHRDNVRIAGLANAEFVARHRNWDICAQVFGRVYRDVLVRVNRPLFRNDDVSWDTSLENFRRFCAVFHKYGQTQIHGVTLRGCTNVVHLYEGTEAEYEGFDTIAKLDNATIRRLSEGKLIEERADLIDWLNAGPDEVALHGLYHTDYSVMSAEQQDRDIGEGLALMRRLFPAKRIRFFIAPFNRANDATYEVAEGHGLTVLAADGVHLEQQLDRLKVQPNQWYRYHHHRFYPESKFCLYKLSIQKLDEALRKNFWGEPSSLE